MKETKKARGTPEEAAFLDVLRTCDLLSRGPAQFLILPHAAKLVNVWGMGAAVHERARILIAHLF